MGALVIRYKIARLRLLCFVGVAPLTGDNIGKVVSTHVYLRCEPIAGLTHYRAFVLPQDAKLAKKLTFPPEFDTKVDMRKVKLEILKPWIVKEVAMYMKTEDDVLTNLIENILHLI